jgi:D-amino peptidase
MKRIYISADIEGSCGIADWKETELTESQGAYFRAEMTREAAAACEAAAEAGIEDIFLKDAHDSGRNIDPSALPERTRIMRAWTRDPYSMMAGIDGSFGGAMFTGYHSAAGSDGNPLAHTMSTSNMEVRINGRRASEFLINAYIAASFGVPPLLVAGDRALCEDALGICPRIEAVPVSEGRGNASISINPSLACRRIKEAASRAIAAVSADPRPFALELPKAFEVEIDFKQHYLAYRGSFYPGASKNGPYGVAFSSASWMEALTFLYFVL